MAKQVINIGSAELAGDGETLRSALNKVNLNFTELYDDDANDITLASFAVGPAQPASLQGAIAYNNATGIFTYTPPVIPTTLLNLGITDGTAGQQLVTDGSGGFTFQTYTETGTLVDETTPKLGGNLDGNSKNITSLGTINSHTIPAGTGTLALASDIPADTDALTEGTTNLYYSDAKINTYLSNNDYDTATNIVASITDSAPTTLDTLNELAAALGDDPNFATTVTTSIAEKLPLAGGTMTGALVLSGAPSADLDAATKKYVDDNTGGGNALSNVVEDTTPQLGGDLDVGGNSIVGGNSPINIAPGGTASINLSADETITTGKILYSNMYAQLADLPSATTYHGMFAHVHATGKGYFAHGGNWVELANMTDVSSGGLANVVEDTTPQLGGDLDCQGFNITMDNGIISTSAGNLQLSSFNYVTIDSANDGQIEIGRSSGTGDVIIGKESNGTSVSFEGVASFDERVLLLKGAEEKYSALTGATGTVAHDCANGKMFYHTTPAADWTVNLTNLDLNQYKYSTSVGIVVTQGGTAYIPNAVQIAGAAQTIIWQGNSTPTGTDNGTDAISFTIMRDGSTYIVLGQLTSFGGV